MHNSKLVFKISDLLKQPGKSDEIVLEDVHLEELQLGGGVSGTVSLKSTNDQSIYVVLENICYTEHLVCDICTTEYTSDFCVEEYSAKFIADKDQEWDDDVVFYISDDQTIDIAPMLVQAITLNHEVANYCESCVSEDRGEEEDDFGSFESSSNIRFL